MFPLTSPKPKYWRGCVPGIPGGVDACDRQYFFKLHTQDLKKTNTQAAQTSTKVVKKSVRIHSLAICFMRLFTEVKQENCIHTALTSAVH